MAPSLSDGRGTIRLLAGFLALATGALGCTDTGLTPDETPLEIPPVISYTMRSGGGWRFALHPLHDLTDRELIGPVLEESSVASWSADGSRVAIATPLWTLDGQRDYGTQIRVLARDGRVLTSRHFLSPGDAEDRLGGIAWSPVDNGLLVGGMGYLAVLDVNTLATLAERHFPGSWLEVGQQAWTLDGQTVAVLEQPFGLQPPTTGLQFLSSSLDSTLPPTGLSDLPQFSRVQWAPTGDILVRLQGGGAVVHRTSGTADTIPWGDWLCPIWNTEATEILVTDWRDWDDMHMRVVSSDGRSSRRIEGTPVGLSQLGACSGWVP